MRRDQVQHRGPVRGSHRQPTLPRLQARIKSNVESKLVDVELKALLLIPDEDRNGVQTEVGVLPESF